MKDYNPQDNPITITCKAADLISFNRLNAFQGKLKSLSQLNRGKLLNSICKEGFMAPFFIWVNNSEYQILDGEVWNG